MGTPFQSVCRLRRGVVSAAAIFLPLAGSIPAHGSQQQPVWVIQSVTVGVPGAPNGESWDTATSSVVGLLTQGIQGLKNIQPDVRVCMESARVPAICTGVCENADWSNESSAYVCTQPTGGSGLLLETNLHVVVQEVDPGSVRQVANFRIDNPAKCQPCTLSTPGGTLWIRFEFARVASYTGPYRAVSGTIPPPSTLPTATPSSGAGMPPPSTPARIPSPEEMESLLSDLRDADNCIGDDMYFPQGTVLTRSLLGQQLGTDQANRLYQMAAFALAIRDPGIQQTVLSKIRSTVGDDTFDGVMTLILGDVSQSQSLLAAYQKAAQYFIGLLAKKGLDKLVPSFQPPTSITPDVDRWILKKLTTDPLVTKAVNMMFSDHMISAECALNELAKEGFIDTISGR